VFFLGCFLMVNSAHAAVATYTLSGGKISGTLDGVSFSDADFTITADADPDNFVPGLVFGFPLLSQPGVSTMTIAGFTPFQITNANFGPFLADSSAFFGPGTGYGGFAFQVSAIEMRGIAVFGSSIELIEQRDSYRSFGGLFGSSYDNGWRSRIYGLHRDWDV
jgi:hypothetical protein